MAHNLHARAVGLIAALILGVGGAIGIPSAVHAADPGPLGVDLSGLTNVTTTIDNTTGAVTGSVDTTVGDTTGSVSGTVDNTAGVVTGTVDAGLGTGSGSASTDGSATLDATAGAGSTSSTTTTSAGATGTAGADVATGGTTDSVANVVSDVASIPVGDNATVGSTTDSTADSVTTTADLVVDPVIDSCVNLPPAGVSVDVGSSCGGGSGILDPITTAVAPVTDPLANVCLSATGVDAQAGTTCTGSGGGSGSGDLLGPVNGVVDQGAGTVAPVLGDLSLSPVDTQPVTDTTNQVVNPLDVCAGVNPINVNEALGAGCDQPAAPCTTLNANCLLTSATDPVVGSGGPIDSVLGACLGYDPLGFNLDIGSACAAATPPPATCPPDCGPQVCTLLCGPVVPTCPPNCGSVTCPPACGTTPAETGELSVTPAITGSAGYEAGVGVAGDTAGGGSLVSLGTSASAVTGLATKAARPPAAPLSATEAVVFAPPAAGDGGLLGRGWGDGSQPADPAFLLIGLLIVACVMRRRRLLHD